MPRDLDRALSPHYRAQKLFQLADIEGYDGPDAMRQLVLNEPLVPGICINLKCDYTRLVEPQINEGLCPCCGTQTMVSCLKLSGHA